MFFNWERWGKANVDLGKTDVRLERRRKAKYIWQKATES